MKIEMNYNSRYFTGSQGVGRQRRYGSEKRREEEVGNVQRKKPMDITDREEHQSPGPRSSPLAPL
jgi:hypothetical protein